MSRREKRYEATLQEIKATARQMMAQEGTAAVSLRGIAKLMDITTPALYRYYANRDNLITALIVDTFNALADAIELARAETAQLSTTEQLMAMSLAYRDFALTHPADFQLIYGNPIPDYEAPAEITVPAVVRTFRAFIEVIALAVEQGDLTPPAEALELPVPIEAHFAELIARDDYPITTAMMYIGVAAWTQLHGLIMLEIFNHLSPTVGDSDLFFRHRVMAVYRDLGLIR